MEQNDNLFGLNLDSQSKSFLAESAKWGKFLAIVGFIVCGLMVVFGLYFLTAKNPYEDLYPYSYGGSSEAAGMKIGMFIGMVLMALLYFFPCCIYTVFQHRQKLHLNQKTRKVLLLHCRT